MNIKRSLLFTSLMMVSLSLLAAQEGQRAWGTLTNKSGKTIFLASSMDAAKDGFGIAILPNQSIDLSKFAIGSGFLVDENGSKLLPQRWVATPAHNYTYDAQGMHYAYLVRDLPRAQAEEKGAAAHGVQSYNEWLETVDPSIQQAVSPADLREMYREYQRSMNVRPAQQPEEEPAG